MFDEARWETGMGDGAELTWKDGALDWRVVDRELRACARRRAALDAEEARWLVAAERLEIHRHFACASIHEYVERVLGHGPRVARDRLRVARLLARLPAMSAALAAGELCHSAVRELTRVATPETERAWIDEARGKCLREIEEAVAGHQRGDRPDDPADAPPRLRTIELELSPGTLALYREALRHLERQLGEPLSDDAAVALMCRDTLGSRRPIAAADTAPEVEIAVTERDDEGAVVGTDEEPVDGAAQSNTPPYQIAITVCSSCERTWQDAGGRSFTLASAELEHAWCDAQVLGRVDGVAPTRATRTIPPAVRRQVVRRDRGRCIVPGCRSTRHLEVHHVIPRAAGGTHDPRGLGLLCYGHHRAVHAGCLEVTGEAPAFVIRRIPASLDPRVPHVGHLPRDLNADPAAAHAADARTDADAEWQPSMIDDAHATLRAAGFSRADAARGVRTALAELGDPGDGPRALETLVRAALRHSR